AQHAAPVAEGAQAVVGGGLPLVGAVAEDVLQLVIGQAGEPGRLDHRGVRLRRTGPAIDEVGQAAGAAGVGIQQLALAVVQRDRVGVDLGVARGLAQPVGGVPAVGQGAGVDVDVAGGQASAPAVGDVLGLVGARTHFQLGAVAGERAAGAADVVGDLAERRLQAADHRL